MIRKSFRRVKTMKDNDDDEDEDDDDDNNNNNDIDRDIHTADEKMS